MFIFRNGKLEEVYFGQSKLQLCFKQAAERGIDYVKFNFNPEFAEKVVKCMKEFVEGHSSTGLPEPEEKEIDTFSSTIEDKQVRHQVSIQLKGAYKRALSRL